MVRPFSHVPSFGGHCCPGVSKPVPADGGSSSSRSGSILPSLFSKIAHTSSGTSGLGERGIQSYTVLTGVTVICAASRLRFSTSRLSIANSSSVMFAVNCPIASVEFTVPCPMSLVKLFARGLNLFPSVIEIAYFNAFSSDHRLWVNCSGVRGSGRLAH